MVDLFLNKVEVLKLYLPSSVRLKITLKTQHFVTEINIFRPDTVIVTSEYLIENLFYIWEEMRRIFL